jgi:hypothetical protein
MIFFGTGVQGQRLLLVWYARWRRNETGRRTAFVGTRRDAGVGVVQGVREGHSRRVGGLAGPFGHHWRIGRQEAAFSELLDLPGVRVYGRRELESSLSTKSALASAFSFGKRVTL